MLSRRSNPGTIASCGVRVFHARRGALRQTVFHEPLSPPNKSDRQPLDVATMKNRLRPVLLLICALAGIAGAKPAGAQISGPTLQLASAIAGDDLAQASAAIADGADVNANAGDGRTPLIPRCCSFGRSW